jgi:putative transposase
MRKPAPRLHTDRYLGRQRYFLTICTFKRRRHFLDAIIVDTCLDHCLRIAAAQYVAITAYCFMPDHVHLLVEGTEAATDMTRLVERARQTTGYALRGVAGEQFWQPGWFDRIIRESDDVQDTLRYLLKQSCPGGSGRERCCLSMQRIGSGLARGVVPQRIRRSRVAPRGWGLKPPPYVSRMKRHS